MSRSNNDKNTNFSWDAINKAAQKVKDACNIFTNKVNALMARVDAARKEVNTGVHHVRNRIKAASAEMRLAESLTEAGKIVHHNVNEAMRDIKAASNKAGANLAHLESPLSEYGKAFKKMQHNLRAEIGTWRSSVDSVVQKIKSYRFMKPANEAAIRNAYNNQFQTQSGRNGDLVFDSDETARTFFMNQARQKLAYYVGRYESGQNIGYVGPKGTLETEANARTWYEQTIKESSSVVQEYQLQGKPSVDQENFIQEYINFITEHRRSDVSNDTDLASTIAPDGRMALKQNMLRFREEENPIKFFEEQAEKGKVFICRTLDDPDNCEFAVSPGNGQLLRGNYAEVMKELQLGFQSSEDDITSKNQYFKVMHALNAHHAAHLKEFELKSGVTEELRSSDLMKPS